MKRLRELLSRRGLFARDYASMLGSSVGQALMSFVSVVLLARWVSRGEFGQVVFAQASMAVVFAFLDLRIEDALMHFMPRIDREQEGAGPRLFRTTLALDAGLSVLFTVAVVIVVSLATPFGETTRTSFMVLAALQNGLSATTGTSSVGYALSDGLSAYGMTRLGTVLFVSTVSIAGLAFAGPTGYLACAAAATAVEALLLASTASRRVAKRHGAPTPLPEGTITRMLRFSVVTSLYSSAAIVHVSLPSAVVGAIGGPARLATYRVGQAPGRLLTAAITPLTATVFPRLSTASAEGRTREIRGMVRVWTLAGVPLLLLAGAVSWVLLPFLLPALFGDKYSDTVDIARYLAIAALLRGLVGWAKVLPTSVGRPGLRLFLISVDGLAITALAAAFATRIERLAIGAVVVEFVIAVALLIAMSSARFLEWLFRRTGASDEDDRLGAMSAVQDVTDQ